MIPERYSRRNGFSLPFEFGQSAIFAVYYRARDGWLGLTSGLAALLFLLLLGETSDAGFYLLPWP
jgi:hypothetical protein